MKTILFALVLGASPAFGAYDPTPVYPAPGGTTFSGSGSAGQSGGRTNFYSGFDESQYEGLLWTFTSIPNPYHSGEGGSGGNMTFSNFDSTTGRMVWNSTSNATWNTAFGLQDIATRLVVQFQPFSGTASGPLESGWIVPITAADADLAAAFEGNGTWPLADVFQTGAENQFQVWYRFETAAGVPLLEYYNASNSLGGNMQTGTSGGFFVGIPDPNEPATFGIDPDFGIVTRPLAVESDKEKGTGVAVLSDGKIVVSVRRLQMGGVNQDVGLVAQYLFNGEVSPEFGDGGTAALGQPWANCVVAQGTGVLAGGVSTQFDETTFIQEFGFGIASLDPAGALVPGFGINGKAFTAFSLENFPSNSRINAMAIQPDGAIVSAGESWQGSISMVLSRHLANGTPDLTFGTQGRVTLPAGTIGRAVMIDGDGNILAAGDSFGDGWDFGVFRLLPDGSPDPDFGVNGLARVSFGSGGDSCFAMALQPDGGVLLAGTTFNGTSYDLAIARLLDTGASDPSFGIDGRVVINAGNASNEQGGGVSILADGRILVASQINNRIQPYNGSLAFHVITPEGDLDESFADGGFSNHSMSSAGLYFDLSEMVVQPDGKAVVVGYVSEASNYGQVVLTRTTAIDAGTEEPPIQTFEWSGLGDSDAWSNGNNWVGGLPPTNNGTAWVVFGDSPRMNPVVDSAWSVHGIELSGSVSGQRTFTGVELQIAAGGVTDTATASTFNFFDLPVRLSANQAWVKQGTNSILPKVSSGRTLDTNGFELLIGAGFSGNTQFSGHISGGGGVRIATSASATLEGNLVLTGGIISEANSQLAISDISYAGVIHGVNAGILSLVGNNSGPLLSQITGTFSQIQVYNGTPQRTIDLNAPQTFQTQYFQGIGGVHLKLGNDQVFGMAQNFGVGGVTGLQASLEAVGGPRFFPQRLHRLYASGLSVLGGHDITFEGGSDLGGYPGSDAIIEVREPGTNLRIEGISAGNHQFPLFKTGEGNLEFGGTGSNTFTYPVVVNGGTLVLNKAPQAGPALAVGGDLSIGDGVGIDRLRLLNRSHQVANTATVTLGANGIFDLGGNIETIAKLEGSGTVGNSSQTSNSNLTVAVPDGQFSTFSGSLVNALDGGTRTMTLKVAGAGTMVLEGTNSLSAVEVESGVLKVNGTIAGGVLVKANGRLSGGGTIAGSVNLSNGAVSTLEPGNGGGTLQIGAGLEFTGDSHRYVVGIDSTAMISARAVVDLFLILGQGVVNLEITDFNPGSPVSGSLMILENIGTQEPDGYFAGLPEGSPLQVGLNQFWITYRGGAGGNDVILSLTPPVPPGSTLDLLVSDPSTQSVRRFDGQTGVAKGNWVASGAGGLAVPRGLVVGPSGALYVTDASANRVKRYSMHDGSFLGDFTPADLGAASNLRFGNDGHLYVISGGSQRQIRKYHGNSGSYISTSVTSTATRMGNATDFEIMSNGDFLSIGSLNRGSRFASSDGAFLSYFLNPTGDLNVMNGPRGIIMGTDGSYWVANFSLNRVTRYSASTGDKLSDIASLAPLNGPSGLVINGSRLFVANATANNIVVYDILDPATGALSAGQVFVPASAGLQAPQHMTMAFINDPPTASAGVDFSLPGGESFTLDATASSDPENFPLTYAWTQLSGLEMIAAPPVTSALVSITAPFTPGTAVFHLLVTDSGGKTDSATVTLTITAPLDLDGNGLPDRWEDDQPTLTGGADDDDDLDGTTNHFEFLAGTDPTDPASVFKLVDSTLAPDQATLRFSSGSRNYQLQHSPDLINWSPVPGHETLPGTGGVIEVTTPSPTGFYRIATKRDF